MFTPQTIRAPVGRDALRQVAKDGFGEMVKAVVDLRRRVMVIGTELHADEEAMLLDEGSQQEDLWGFNLYPDRKDDSWIVFDSMINIRPRQNNRSRTIGDPAVIKQIREFIHEFVLE